MPTYLRGAVPPDDTGQVAWSNVAALFTGSTPTARKRDGWVQSAGVFTPAAGGTLGATFVSAGYLPAGMNPATAKRVQMMTTMPITIDCIINTNGLVQIRTFFSAGNTYTTSTTFTLDGYTWRTD